METDGFLATYCNTSTNCMYKLQGEKHNTLDLITTARPFQK